MPWLHFCFISTVRGEPRRFLAHPKTRCNWCFLTSLPLPSPPGYCVKLVCIHPIRYHGQIQRGQQLGRMLPMQKVFPGIISHIHVENCDHSDPTHLLTPGKVPNQPTKQNPTPETSSRMNENSVINSFQIKTIISNRRGLEGPSPISLGTE